MKFMSVLLTLFFVNLASANTKVEMTSLLINDVNKDISIDSRTGHLRTYPDVVWQVAVSAGLNQQVVELKSAELDSPLEAEQLQTRLREIVLSHFSALPVQLTTTETKKIVHCLVHTTTYIQAEVLEHNHSQSPIILTGTTSMTYYDYSRCDF